MTHILIIHNEKVRMVHISHHPTLAKAEKKAHAIRRRHQLAKFFGLKHEAYLLASIHKEPHAHATSDWIHLAGISMTIDKETK